MGGSEHPPQAFSEPVRPVMAVLGVALLYFALAQLSLSHFSVGPDTSVAWLPGGMALAVLLMYGRHFAWSVLLGHCAFMLLLQGSTAGMALALGGINALAALAGAWLTTRGAKFDANLRTLPDFVRLIVFAGGISGLLAAVFASAAMLWMGSLAPANYLQHVLGGWIGNLVGILLMTPLILIWHRPPLGWLAPGRLVEVSLLLLLAFFVGQFVFLGWFKDPLGAAAQSYWLFVVVAVAAVRLGRHGVVLILLMVAVQGLVGALQGTGPFAGTLAQSRLASYGVYMLALSGFGMAGATYLSELRRVQSKLAEREAAQQRQFTDNSTVMLLVDQTGRVLDANQAALRFYGYAKDRFLTLQIADISQRSALEILDTLSSAVQADGNQFESRHRLSDGTVRDVSVSSSPLDFGNQRVLHTIVFDITDRKRAEAEIQNLAFFDPLTRLPNRRLLLDRLRQAIAASERSQRTGALLFIDLDNFKLLNDKHGHEKGDLLLQHVADRLAGCIRQGDTVARLGGDEFVIMLKDLSHDAAEAIDQAAAVAAKVLAALRLPYRLGGFDHHSSGSIGIARFGQNGVEGGADGGADYGGEGTNGTDGTNKANAPNPMAGRTDTAGDAGADADADGCTTRLDGADTVQVLFKRADLALYQAKATGRNVARFFDPAMQLAVTARAALEADLRHALQADQLVLHYQPQVNAEGRLTGAEVLARWKHPKLGMVPPVQFIRLAEDTGLILPLGHWVLQTTCMQLAKWASQRETQHLTLSANVSVRQFQEPGFVDEVLAVIRTTGAPPNRLKIELTESLLADDVDSIIMKMDALKAQGVGFSLDDFGTGYSSLSYLKRLPLDQLKIDQSFVRDALTDPNDAAIAKTIVALGQSLGLTVIAEGVETQAQRDFLWQNGCYAYQGYFFGRPGPLDALDSFITRPAPLA